jgi:hypothetical protein
MSERFDQIKEFYQSDSTLAGVLRDLISVAKILLVFAILEPMWEGGPIAPHAGYITKGDNIKTNRQYDQYNLCTVPIREEWVIGVARYRIPYAGYVRLAFSKVIEILAGYDVGRWADCAARRIYHKMRQRNNEHARDVRKVGNLG